MILRPYQEAAQAAILQEWDDGNRKTLLVLPTGTGKTIVFCKLAEERVRRGDRILILAHRGELLSQAADKMSAATGLACAVEKGEESSVGAWERIVVGSVQSLMREKRLHQFKPDHFDVIIVDEAHHVMADSYLRILNYFEKANVLGVTATPDRSDMKNLGQYFDSLAYEYSLPQAIREGYLCPIKAQTIPLEIDIASVRQQAGDYALKDIGTALDPYLEKIADEMAVTCQGRKTVVFLPLIATSRKMTHMLKKRGMRAAEINGQSKDREKILREFNAGRYDVLCNSMLLTEGWDCPSVDCIVVLRPTKSRSLYCQMVGRGTRLSNDKDHLLLLDFLWHSESHELCRPAALIAEEQEIAQKMTENLNEACMPIDIIDAVETATEDVIAQREEALANKLAQMRKKKRTLVDPLQFEMSIHAVDLANYTPSFGWEMGPASQKQIDTLEKLGIFASDIECAGKARLLLDKLDKRRSEGLATPKQIRLLENKGFKNVGMWPFDSAQKMIARIAANGWRTPPGIDVSNYG